MELDTATGAGRRARFFAVLPVVLMAVLVLMAVGCKTITAPSQANLAAQGGITGAVARWLEEYRQAWSTGDSVKLGRMLGLNEAEIWSLQHVFEERRDLRVSFDEVRIEPVDGALARATYIRRDRWVDRATGQPRLSSAAYEQTFRLADGKVRPIGLRRR